MTIVSHSAFAYAPDINRPLLSAHSALAAIITSAGMALALLASSARCDVESIFFSEAITTTIPTNWGSASGSALFGDFTGDGVPDVAFLASGTLHLGKGDGTGAFTISVADTTNAVGSLRVADDFDMDGRLDLATAGDGGLQILLARGEGTFVRGSGQGYLGGTAAATVGDFDNDGRPDVASIGYLNIRVALNHGNGVLFSHETRDTYRLPTPVSIAAGDLDNDGNLDLITGNNGTMAVSFLFGRGDGTFSQPIAYERQSYDYSWYISVGDFNGDGLSDFAFTSDYAPTIRIYWVIGQGCLGFRRCTATGFVGR